MKNISIKGIILGIIAIAIIDIIGSISGIFLFAHDMSSESLNAINLNQSFLLWSLFIGSISTVIGGFIAAKYGKSSPYKNSSIIGLLGIIVGVLSVGDAPLWADIAGFLTVIPAALFGGFLVAQKNA